MKSWIFGLLIVTASIVWGQDSKNTTQTDLSRAPLISSADTPKLPENPFDAIRSIPLPIKVTGCAVSISEDALFIWGTNESNENRLILLSLESGKILAEAGTQRQIVHAQLTSSHIYLTHSGNTRELIQLERENLRETGLTANPEGRHEIINELLLYGGSEESCFLLPELEKFAVISKEAVERYRRHGETKFGRCVSGFTLSEIFWTHDLKPKYLIGPSIFPTFGMNDTNRINCELISSGHVLFSRLTTPTNFVVNQRMRPALLNPQQQVLFCDPYSYEPIKAYKNIPGTVVAHSSRYVFILHEGKINLIPVPDIPEPASLEPLNTTWTIKHQGPTKFSFRLAGATRYKMEMTGLPAGVKSVDLTSATGEFEVDMQNLLPSIYANLSATSENKNLRHELDTVAPLFETLIGNKPKGCPFVVRINVAALTHDLQYRVFQHYCFLELPLSKIHNVTIGQMLGTSRVWTDKNGQSFRGELIKVVDKSLSIKRESADNPTLIPISDLSDFDRAWVGIPEFEPAIP